MRQAEGLSIVERPQQRYKSPKLLEALQQRQADVENVIRPVPGFVAYYLIKVGEGGASVTVCEDKAGADASIQRAAGWIRQNLPDVAGAPPEITEGEVIQHFSK